MVRSSSKAGLRSIKRLIRLVLLAALAAAACLWYGLEVEPDLLCVRQYALQAGNGAPTETIRLVQLSDIQMGEAYTIENLRNVVQKVQQQQPDVILFSGDLFEDYSRCGAELEPEVTALLQSLAAPGGKYAVWGNRDYGGGAEKAYRRILKAAGFTLLRNTSAEIVSEQGHKILLCGLDDSLFGKPDGSRFLPEQATDCDYRILLLHEPDVAQLWSHSAFQLILAGHSHGGQVRLPFWQGEKTALAQQYVRHFYTLNEETGLQLYVNTGLGTSHIPVRFGVIPEIAVFDLAL